MDWYTLVKFAHVACAVVWVGGGFALMLSATRADRAGDVAATLQVMRMTSDLGNRLFVPASMLTLLTGLVMCWFWIGYRELWILIGLAGFFISGAIGSAVFKPTADRMNALVAEHGVTPAALSLGRRIITIARLDYTVMLLVIAAMVLKPTLEDTAVLFGMGIVFVLGLASARGGFQRVPAAAEA